MYFEKIRVFKTGFCLNRLAWDTKIRHEALCAGANVMTNRNYWGCSYLLVRGEILGFRKDVLMRKHSSRMFSLIKNES